jgi:hypothetical protein
MNDARAAWAARSVGCRTAAAAAACNRFGENRRSRAVVGQRSYLVDPASSRTFVSEIRPCMSKHKL